MIMQGYCPDGSPLTSELVDVVHASDWIGMLAAPKLWSALRRIPPKEHILQLVEAFLRYANSTRYYAFIEEGACRPDVTLRRMPTARLRELLIAWEPPVVTPEIREAARAVHLAEYGEPPRCPWDDIVPGPQDNPLEATLIWPEGRWDEAAFQAAQAVVADVTVDVDT